MRNTAVAMMLFGAISCEQNHADRAQPVASAIQAGTEEIAPMLRKGGQCLVGRLWAYMITPDSTGYGDAMVFKTGDGEFEVMLSGPAGEMQSGHVNTEKHEVDWIHTREYRPRVDDHPTEAEGRAEWGTPRGQLAVKLVEKAESACDSSADGLRTQESRSRDTIRAH